MPDHRHAVGTIGRHVEIHDDIVAVRLEAFERQAAHAHQRADLFRRRRDVDEFADPGERDLHSPNCSRKRRSFS